MTQTAQISCINKDDRYNPYERITHVGGYGKNHWKTTQQAAIGYIENGEWEFYVGNSIVTRVRVIVAMSPHNNKYLKTEADGEEPNNLLSLPECP